MCHKAIQYLIYLNDFIFKWCRQNWISIKDEKNIFRIIKHYSPDSFVTPNYLYCRYFGNSSWPIIFESKRPSHTVPTKIGKKTVLGYCDPLMTVALM